MCRQEILAALSDALIGAAQQAATLLLFQSAIAASTAPIAAALAASAATATTTLAAATTTAAATDRRGITGAAAAHLATSAEVAATRPGPDSPARLAARPVQLAFLTALSFLTQLLPVLPELASHVATVISKFSPHVATVLSPLLTDVTTHVASVMTEMAAMETCMVARMIPVIPTIEAAPSVSTAPGKSAAIPSRAVPAIQVEAVRSSEINEDLSVVDVSDVFNHAVEPATVRQRKCVGGRREARSRSERRGDE
jgi:hypothetical protein